MSSHLPECPRSSIPDKYADAAAKIGIHAGDCICSALRACEQRVLKAAWEAVKELEPLLGMEKYKGGYDCCGCSTPTSLYVDVIAALREVQP